MLKLRYTRMDYQGGDIQKRHLSLSLIYTHVLYIIEYRITYFHTLTIPKEGYINIYVIAG